MILESLNEQSIVRNVFELEASTMIWMTSARTITITHSLRCWGAGHLAITSRHVGSGMSCQPRVDIDIVCGCQPCGHEMPFLTTIMM